MTDGTAAEALAGLGNYDDNGPPNFSVDAIDQLKRELAPFMARRDEFVAKLSKVGAIRSRDDVGAAADLTKLARAVETKVDAARKRIGDPHDDAVKAVNGYAREFWGPVTEALTVLRAKVDTFVNAEDQRIRDQAAEQQREERRLAAERATSRGAPPPPPPPAPIPAKRRAYRGDLGGQAIVRDEYDVVIDDVRLIPDFIFQTTKVREAIVDAARFFRGKGIETIAGLTITTRAKTHIRK